MIILHRSGDRKSAVNVNRLLRVNGQLKIRFTFAYPFHHYIDTYSACSEALDAACGHLPRLHSNRVGARLLEWLLDIYDGVLGQPRCLLVLAARRLTPMVAAGGRGLAPLAAVLIYALYCLPLGSVPLLGQRVMPRLAALSLGRVDVCIWSDVCHMGTSYFGRELERGCRHERRAYFGATWALHDCPAPDLSWILDGCNRDDSCPRRSKSFGIVSGCGTPFEEDGSGRECAPSDIPNRVSAV